MPARKDLDLTTFSGRFAARMLELRIAAGLTGREAAEKLEMSYNTLQQWENGRSRPKISELPKIAQAYGVSAREIIPENF